MEDSFRASPEQGMMLRFMGFNIPKLEFLRWLVRHEKNPEWVGAKLNGVAIKS